MKLWIAVTQNQAVAESLRSAVTTRGLFYVEPDVEAALRRLISVRPDAVIVDDGHGLGREAVQRIHEFAPRVHIIALSARPHRDVHASYVLAGAKSVLDKPFDCDTLQQALETTEVAENAGSVPLQVMPSYGGPVVAGDAQVQRYRSAMRWLTRATGQLDDPLEIAQRMCETVTDLFDTVRTAVILHVDGRPRLVAAHGIPEPLKSDLALDYHRGVLLHFELEPVALDVQTRALDVDAQREMDLLGARVALPIVVAGRNCGALMLGERADGAPYGPDDRELLGLLVRGAAACLEQTHQRRTATRQQHHLDTVLKHITAGVVAVDADRRITMINRSAENILQVSESEVRGQSVQKLGSAFADVVLRTLRDGKPRLRQAIRDVAVRAELGLSVTPLGDEGAVVIFNRLDEQPRNEDPAHSAIWQYLSSRVAQEIKNPMVAINTFAQLLPTRHDSAEFRDEFADVVQREVGRINQVVETLYEFARNPRLNLRKGTLNDRATHCLQAFSEDLEARNIDVELDLSPDATTVDIDAEMFDDALNRLLQNSLDAMPTGGKLRIKTMRNNGYSALEVSDTGTGISDQDAPHIFTPFFSTKENGMGLGLTLARRIVQEHHGVLTAETPDDTGSRFVIKLPAEPAKTL